MKGTESNNIFSREIETWETDDVLEFIHMADILAYDGVSRAMEQIKTAMKGILERVKNGGRIIYVGAGTSGRLATQDVAELWPTYGIGQELFDCIMAGGDDAIKRSVEGAEDDRDEPIKMLKEKAFNNKDVLIGISASGSTPFVLSAIEYANKIGALSVGITNNLHKPIHDVSKISVTMDTGPEVIQGSTRMKAGTSQKMVLNMISTTVAVKLGYTHRNIMSHMGAWYNEKLKKRAQTMLIQEFNLSDQEARSLLEKYEYRIEPIFKLLKKEEGEDKER